MLSLPTAYLPLYMRLIRIVGIFLAVIWLLTYHLASSVSAKTIGGPKIISGYVLDSITHQPVPGVLVRASLIGKTVTDQQGHFSLPVPKRRVAWPYALYVSTLAYQGRTLVTHDIARTVTLLVSRRKLAFQLRADSCLLSADIQKVNPKSTPTLAEDWPGNMYAVFVANNLRTARTIRTITLRTAEIGQYMIDPTFPFRLRVFAVDSLTRQPAYDLLTENVVLCISQKDQTNTIGLSQYAIPAPQQGFYIAIEGLLGDGDHLWPCPDATPNYRPVGPILRAPCASADSRSWRYAYPVRQWQPTPPEENCWPLYERLFEIEVTP
jgi:hypothetical protein